MRALIAEKKEMTHIFDEKGNFVPVTVLLATPNKVVQVKKEKTDGYEAIQVGFGERENHKKPQRNHLKKSGSKAKLIKEVPLESGKEYKVGDRIGLDIFKEGERVSVRGVSKGKGFAGTIKRHNFHRGPATHGSRNLRAPGSIGAAFPQHVFKGKKLPGRMGVQRTTVKNLEIARIIKDEDLLLVKGAVPGPKKGLVLILAEKEQEKKRAMKGQNEKSE